ncbi:MAG TPA: N-acetylmuramoyl-L-alanine amidase [Solirubrobacteraceae bacterium]|nr:N-acetylmuramoyl-L-alanine amidase [Solirubrobacteraceae bacterium]
MSEGPHLTRRALLGGLAGAGAAGLLRRPGAAIAAAPPAGEPGVFSEWVGTVAGRSREIVVARPFTMAGVQWEAPRSARIELRARSLGGRWSRWGVASTLGHGPDRPASEALIGEPVWTGAADVAEVRSSQPLAGVRLHFVDVGAAAPGAATARAATAGAATAAAAPMAQPVLHAGPGQPPIIARAGWAGRGSLPAVVPGYGEVKMAFVHHTDSLNGYGRAEVPAIIQGMYVFHRFVRGWDDVGYNFLIDLYGRIWEARQGGIDEAVVGAQAGGYNLQSTGVGMIGTFTGVVPSSVALASLQRLIAWKLSLHGVPAVGHVTVVVNPADYFYTPFRPGQHVSLPRVAGHRDGCTTDCPGNAFYARLPMLRPRIKALAGPVARIELFAPAEPGSASAPVAVPGRLTDLGGAPIAGAPVEVQRFSATVHGASTTTIATATTGADGSFTAMVALTQLTLLRALHRAAPAAVSTLVSVEVAPAITVSIASTVPLTVTGTVDPPTKKATIELFTVQPDGHWQSLSSKQVPVRHGAFTATLTTPGPGAYGLSVHTPADAVSAAGASAPVLVTVT